ncbi:Transmembrane protein 17 [Plasmodiophora brassicae]|nr:hypothetical protein PBRA_006515 [Plasmodiophora brassicae]
MAITRPEELVSPGGAFPGYAVPSRHVPKQLVRERQVASSLALQMALYYNAFYSALHAFIAILGIRYKMMAIGPGALGYYLMPLLFSVWAVVEIGRLLLGYAGNLRERVQHLAAFFFLTIFPQLFLVAASCVLQTPRWPLDSIAGGIQLAFLLFELVVGYFTVRRVIGIQTTRFRLDYQPAIPIVRPRRSTLHL